MQVTKVKANMIKRPYDTSIGLTVHSLLVVDALQTYGHDFELLIASHRGVRYAEILMEILSLKFSK